MNITFTKEQLKHVKQFAQNLEIGGKSHVRSQAERQKTLKTDQIVGQLGEAALHVWLTGEFDSYIVTQEMKKATIKRGQGDNGKDIYGTPLSIDIKTTRINNKYTPTKFKLIVSNPEHKLDIFYVQAFVIGDVANPTVHIAGWAYGTQLKPLQGYSNAVGVSVPDLNPLRVLKVIYRESTLFSP